MCVSNLIGQKLGCCNLICLIYIHNICSKTVISKLIVGQKTHYVLSSKMDVTLQGPVCWISLLSRYLSFALKCMYLYIDFSFKYFVLYIQLYIDLFLHFHQSCIQFYSDSCIHFIPVFYSTSISSLTCINYFKIYSFQVSFIFTFLHNSELLYILKEDNDKYLTLVSYQF